MIEDKTACSFQAAIFILEQRVIDHLGDAIILTQFLDNILPTLASPQG